MRLTDTVSGAPAAAMLGMCKNAGKTTAMNALIRDFPESGVLCVTSIGRDGESRDLVTGTDKPSVWIREGMLAATAEDLLPLCDVSREILAATGIHTSLGEVIIFRARSGGFVQLAGPSIVDQLGRLRQMLEPFAVDQLLIDGALSRKSPLSAVPDGVCILSTGAALDRDMDTVTAETAFTAELLCLPAFSGKFSPDGEDGSPGNPFGKVRIRHTDGREEQVNRPAEIRTLSAEDSIVFPGALTESHARELLRNRAVGPGVTIAVRDSSCMLLKRDTFAALIRREVRFAVKNPAHLAAVTVNPVSPEGWRFDPDEFLEKMGAAVRVPVLDILRETGRCG